MVLIRVVCNLKITPIVGGFVCKYINVNHLQAGMFGSTQPSKPFARSSVGKHTPLQVANNPSQVVCLPRKPFKSGLQVPCKYFRNTFQVHLCASMDRIYYVVKPLYQARESSLVPLRLLRFMKPLLLSSVDTFCSFTYNLECFTYPIPPAPQFP